MASCKIIVWLVFVLAATLISAKAVGKSTTFKHKKNSPEFRKNEEYFQPAQSQDALELQEKSENCEKVMKNSMICMICKDKETNAKYEQCSYVSHPDVEIRLDPKSNLGLERSQSLQAKPRTARDYSEESGEEEGSEEPSSPYSSDDYYSSNNEDGGDGGGGDESEGDEKSNNDDGSPSNYDSFRSYPTSAEFTSESERISQNVDKNKCEEVQKDDMICLVCKDPENGGNSQKCSYAFEPNDKVYKYSRSKSIGYPENSNKSELNKRKTKKTPRSFKRSENEEFEPEESQVTENTKNGCHEVVKDSMICTICKNPETNANSENCSYSYKPGNKLYAYTASKSFGTPKKSGKKSTD